MNSMGVSWIWVYGTYHTLGYTTFETQIVYTAVKNGRFILKPI